MFDIEQATAQWRRRLHDAGLPNRATLDELESHLREDFRALLARGEPEARAFDLASARLGQPKAVQREFAKIRPTRNRPLLIGLLIWGLYGIIVTTFMGTRLLAHQIDAMMFVHTIALVTGSIAAFVGGGIAAWTSGRVSRMSGSSSSDLASERACSSFLHISALLMIVGLASGLAWIKTHLGAYWLPGAAVTKHDLKTSIGAAREIGTLLAVVGLLASTVAPRFFRLRSRGVAAVSASASLLVSLAWFVPFTFGGSAGYVCLAIFLALNLSCAALGAFTAPKFA